MLSAIKQKLTHNIDIKEGSSTHTHARMHARTHTHTYTPFEDRKPVGLKVNIAEST